MAKKVITVSIVGVGSMAQTIHIPMIKALVGRLKLVMLVDPFLDEKEFQKLSERLNCQWSRRVEDIRSDLTVIATPITTHFETSCEVLKHSPYLLVEKPITDMVAGLNELIAQKNKLEGRRIFCGHIRRFYKNVNLAKKVISGNLLGRVEEVKLFEGNLYGWNRKFYSKSRSDRKKNTDEGVLFDVGSHGVDSFAYIFGEHLSDFQITQSIVDDPELMSNIFFTGRVQVTNQKEPFEWSASFSNTTALANMIWIKGETATLIVPLTDTAKPKLRTAHSTEVIELDMNWQSANPFYVLYDTILNAVHGGTRSVLDIENFGFTTKILESGYDRSIAGQIPWLE